MPLTGRVIRNGLAAIAWGALAVALFARAAYEAIPVSKPGCYRGFTEWLYTEWQRTSQYVTVRDETRLAVDVYHRARDGHPVDRPLPVLWIHHTYHRADRRGGQLVRPVDQLARLRKFLQYGYVIGIVDMRGSGASFGTQYGPLDPSESLDAYDITEWFAAQRWCDGNVGMIGRSYMGISQYLAAATRPPHLKAILPEMAMVDLYDFDFPVVCCATTSGSSGVAVCAAWMSWRRPRPSTAVQTAGFWLRHSPSTERTPLRTSSSKSHHSGTRLKSLLG